MISIIVCSRIGNISAEIKQNIAETIGCEFELTEIDNSDNRYSIFQAYNEGVGRSKGEILCFMHEDVLFRSQGWGTTIVKHFYDCEEIGLIGFAGTHFLPDTPMYWYSSPFISQHNLNNDQGIVEEHFHEEWFNGEVLIETVAVDGFCFFVRKALFDRIFFDDKTYNGFHMYDMDICMQVIEAGCKVCVCRSVLPEHCWSENKQFSKRGGDLFFYNLELFSEKWHCRLPIHKGLDLPEEMFDRVNRLCRQSYETKQIRESKAFKLGKTILSPLGWIKKK